MHLDVAVNNIYSLFFQGVYSLLRRLNKVPNSIQEKYRVFENNKKGSLIF